MNKIKIIVLYRVIQEWRKPVFDRLANKYDLKVYYGPDFPNSKVVSTKKLIHFNTKKLYSLKFSKESSNGLIAMPFSPFLFFNLLIDKPDVIITEGASNLINATIAFLYCKLFNKKFIWWSLGKLENTKYNLVRQIINYPIEIIERNSNCIITYSTVGKDYFKAINVPDNKIFVAVNVVDTDKITQRNTSLPANLRNQHRFNILFVGSLTRHKNLKILIEAFSDLENKYDNCSLTIVGSGNELNNLINLSNELGVRNIYFPGQDFDNVSRYFINSDVFVLPGLGGLAISEALAYGIPVIASIGDGCEKDLIIQNENGIIDINLNRYSLLNYLSDLYENPHKLATYKINAKNIIQNKYNINTYMNQIDEAIKYAINC